MTLTPDQLLATTRAVRKRLDFARPVDPALIDQCLELALQAPSGSNGQPWRFVVITEAGTKAAIAEHYRASFAEYIGGRGATTGNRVAESASYLAERFHEVPVMLLACVAGRPEGRSVTGLSALYGSVLQACWSFQLAARVRGLGTCFTTLHLPAEKAVADLLGIPIDRYTQVGLITVGHVIGADFHPAARRALDEVVRRERW